MCIPEGRTNKAHRWEGAEATTQLHWRDSRRPRLAGLRSGKEQVEAEAGGCGGAGGTWRAWVVCVWFSLVVLSGKQGQRLGIKPWPWGLIAQGHHGLSSGPQNAPDSCRITGSSPGFRLVPSWAFREPGLSPPPASPLRHGHRKDVDPELVHPQLLTRGQTPRSSARLFSFPQPEHKIHRCSCVTSSLFPDEVSVSHENICTCLLFLLVCLCYKGSA